VEMLLPLVIFAVLLIPMFLMTSKQRKAQRAQQEKIKTLGIGDEVRTHSGFYGLIVDQFDDVVILETEDGSQTKWARAALAEKVEPTVPGEGASEGSGEDSEAGEVDAPTNGEVPGVTAPSDEPGSAR
jgi:preprotein translocase subunit YajC